MIAPILFIASFGYAIVISSYDQFTKANFAQESQVTFGSFDFPAGKSLVAKFMTGATVKFTGKISFPKGNWKIKENLVIFKGDKVKISGGTFNGSGNMYWDGRGMHTDKPRFFGIETTNSVYSDMKIINAPVFMFQIRGNGNTFDGMVLETIASKPKTKNTDGFGISANDIVIRNSIVTNQDDCVAINRGNNILIENVKCIGGHGISIGSMRNGFVVDGVKVLKCQVINSENGFRVKGWYNDKGTVKNVLVNGLTLSGIEKGGVVIIQDYAGGPFAGKFSNGFNIQYSDIKLMNVVGSVLPKASLTILKCSPGHCKNIDLQGVKLSANGKHNTDTDKTDVSDNSEKSKEKSSQKSTEKSGEDSDNDKKATNSTKEIVKTTKTKMTKKNTKTKMTKKTTKTKMTKKTKKATKTKKITKTEKPTRTKKAKKTGKGTKKKQEE